MSGVDRGDGGGGFRAPAAEALAACGASLEGGGRSLAVLMRRGGLLLEYYAPRGVDDQRPHSRDELYLVERGSGVFVLGGERVPFAPGDALFVPAGVEHRFEDFGEDLGVWVVFFGPEGGSAP